MIMEFLLNYYTASTSMPSAGDKSHIAWKCNQLTTIMEFMLKKPVLILIDISVAVVARVHATYSSTWLAPLLSSVQTSYQQQLYQGWLRLLHDFFFFFFFFLPVYFTRMAR